MKYIVTWNLEKKFKCKTFKNYIKACEFINDLRMKNYSGLAYVITKDKYGNITNEQCLNVGLGLGEEVLCR